MTDATQTRPHGGRASGETAFDDVEVMRLRLVFGEGLVPADHRLGMCVDVVDAPTTLGREATRPGHCQLPDDDWASRQHCRVCIRAGQLLIEDLASRNGLFVNGQRIEGQRALTAGDVVRVGGSVFVAANLPVARANRILAQTPPPDDFVAWSWPALALWGDAMRVASANDGVLILGELGTGKTRLARHIHRASGRSGPFEAHNCSAIPVNLEEATLFGVVDKFIPGVQGRVGLLTRAAGGTLFLDELADLPRPAQAKLLDAFDPSEPSYLPVGARKRLQTRCRLISATNQDVFALAQTGVLRADLVSRLATIQLTVPPLRQRREDILPILRAGLARRGMHHKIVTNAETAELLLMAPWTENIRGVESLAARIALGERLTSALIEQHAGRGVHPKEAPSEQHLPRDMPLPADTPPSAIDVEQIIWPPTSAELLQVLHQVGWRLKDAATLLQKRNATLSRLLKARFGGLAAAKKAWRVWQLSGRIPASHQVAATFALFNAPPLDANRAARDHWSRDGVI